MLKELYLEFEDGRKERNIIHLNPGEQVKIYPQRDKIVISNCKSFKYKVEKHPYLCVAIANFGGEYKIMPAGVSCIPGTTLNDIEVINNLIPKEPASPREKHTWKFKSSSSDSTYVVKENWGKLRCDCMGSWRSKDRKCKHIKEVEQELNKQK